MSLKKKIIELLNKKFSNTELYLFGSIVYSEEFNDIDLAIIYDKTNVTISEIIEYRKTIKQQLYKQFKLNSDILLLSKEENLEMNFLLNAKTIRIY